jgi:predicted ATPase
LEKIMPVKEPKSATDTTDTAQAAVNGTAEHAAVRTNGKRRSKKLAVQSFRLKNFKAVRDSKTIKFTPLTVFIGNNGSGKSSIVEGLETLQMIATKGLDEAMNAWSGFEYVWHKGRLPNAYHRPCVSVDERPHYTEPMSFDICGNWRDNKTRPIYRVESWINVDPSTNNVYIQRERNVLRDPSGVEASFEAGRDASGARVEFEGNRPEFTSKYGPITDGESIHSDIRNIFVSWQFLSMNPLIMGDPIPQKRTSGPVRLARDGSNVADYLREIMELDPWAFHGILDALQFVLPYATDLQPILTSELGRNVHVELTEGDLKVPGWLLSSGTLRVVALLALFRHPNPPPLIVIEEIENGLDPRTVGLLVEEIRSVIEYGKSQVIVTTHSPYLLDLLSLSHIITVERVNGQPTFTRPVDRLAMTEWAKRFSPGQLYTMGVLSQRNGK